MRARETTRIAAKGRLKRRLRGGASLQVIVVASGTCGGAGAVVALGRATFKRAGDG